MRKGNLFVVILISFMILISACTTNDQPHIDTSSNKDYEQGYPSSSENTKRTEENNYFNSYPIIEEENSPEQLGLEIPEPSVDSGVLYGEVQSIMQGEPLRYTKIYLATKIFDDSGESYILSIKENSSPNTQTIYTGEFVIKNIPPGDYILVIVTPINTMPVLDESSDQIEISIVGGVSINLGKLYVDWPSFD